MYSRVVKLLTSFEKPIQAILFDCDGVLVDTEYLKFLAWQKAFGCREIPFSIDEYEPLIGYTTEAILQKLKVSKGLDIEDEVVLLRKKFYHELQQQGVPPIEKMVHLVQQLIDEKEDLKIRLGVVSSASTEEIGCNLKHIGLSTGWDIVVSGTDDLDAYIDDEGKNKPKPYIYLEAARQLELQPTQCLVFEDTEAGIEAAFSAGMHVIAVPNMHTQKQNFSKADLIF